MALTIDLGALAANWTALAKAAPGARPGAVLKADAYGLGAARVVSALHEAGARDFFICTGVEGQAIRPLVGPDARIFVLEGHVPGAPLEGLIPCLVSPEQFFRDRSLRPNGPFAVQLDTGMNRLGFAAPEWAALRAEILAAGPDLLMSHLYDAGASETPRDAQQLARFRSMTEGAGVARSLAATGGILLGPDYHFDLTRPGIGIYGGLPFAQARKVARLTLPLQQLRWVEPGEVVGYGGTWTAPRRSRIATVTGGYGDGLPRALWGSGITLFAGTQEVPLVGRVSMDVITLDVTDLAEIPDEFEVFGPNRSIDAYAAYFDSIGYEALTALGRRYERYYL